jgi:ADP-ribose pyrophosphatase YjhB (NUDIX family)
MMNYCTTCGHKLVRKIPPGDSLERFVCESCLEVHYQNPRVITGCVAHWQRKILLCRRAIEPRTGSWALPAGYMENGETLEQGALREAREETGANIRLDTLYSVFDIESINQVYIIFRGVLMGPGLTVGVECSEVRLFAPEEIPWDNLFYPAIGDLLERYVADLALGKFSLYTGTSKKGRVARIERDDI